MIRYVKREKKNGNHELAVPYEQLSKEEQEKDYNYI